MEVLPSPLNHVASAGNLPKIHGLVSMAEKVADCPLLVLPLEIRTMIYHFLWDGDEEATSIKYHFIPPLAAAFPVIQHECCDVFFEPCTLRSSIFFRDRRQSRTLDFNADYGLWLHRYGKCLWILHKDKQVSFRSSLAHVTSLELRFHCYDDMDCKFPGDVDESSRTLRQICHIKIDLSKTKVSDNDAISLHMKSRLTKTGDGRKDWIEGDPEYEFSMSAPSKLMAVLRNQDRPLRYSQTLFQDMLTALKVLAVSFPGLIDSVIDQ